jgi:hypothetical protein
MDTVNTKKDYFGRALLAFTDLVRKLCGFQTFTDLLRFCLPI